MGTTTYRDNEHEQKLRLFPTPVESARAKVLLGSRRKDHTRGTGQRDHFGYLWTAAITVRGKTYEVTSEDGPHAALSGLVRKLAEALDAEQLSTVTWLLKGRAEIA